MAELMTTREVAEYLRLRERKIYDLVRNGAIPCTRVTGKWLFPRSLIDLWLLENAEGDTEPRARPAAVVAGSHDMLLEWAVQASEGGLALLFGGSTDGLNRFVRGEASVCGMHIPEKGHDQFNVETVRAAATGDCVLVEWARRSQGLMLPADNPLGIKKIGDVVERGARVIDRQQGAGSRLLLDRLLNEAGVSREAVQFVDEVAVNHTDVAREVHEGHADAGLGIEPAARGAGLAFIPLAQERFDLLIDRREYFEAPVQALLNLTRSRRFTDRAAALGGYDLSGTGTIHYNAP